MLEVYQTPRRFRLRIIARPDVNRERHIAPRLIAVMTIPPGLLGIVGNPQTSTNLARLF